MTLVHYSAVEVTEVYEREQGHSFFKPCGLWVSDDDCEDNWLAWCLREGFRLSKLTHIHQVELTPNANVLIINNEGELDRFNQVFQKNLFQIDWLLVKEMYDGLIITPYLWSRRLDMDMLWYNCWDCASGCLWNPEIVKIKLGDVVALDTLRCV